MLLQKSRAFVKTLLRAHSLAACVLTCSWVMHTNNSSTVTAGQHVTELRWHALPCVQVAAVKPTAHQQDQQPNNLPEPMLQQLADAPVRITRSKTRALAQGVSLSSLLQARSAAGKSSRRSGSLSAPPPSPVPDIDAPDRHNHLAECQYVNAIYAFFRRIEPRFRAPPNYMENQVS